MNKYQIKRLSPKLKWILLPFFLFGVIFYSSRDFVEREILPKEYLFIFFSLLFGGVTLLGTRQPIQSDRLTCSVFAFITYLILISAFTSTTIQSVLYLTGFIFLLFFFTYNNLSYKIINHIIIALCVLQAGYGLIQFFHLTGSTTNFAIVGSYDNPAGFAACLAVAFPLIFSLLKLSKLHKLGALFAVIIIGVAIILSGSRAGILTITIVSIVFLYSKFSNQLRQYKKYVIPTLFISGVVLFIFLFSLKKDSASGRLLIWQITWEMIKDNPIFGSGNGSFLANYMNYQADHFIQNPNSKYTLLADNVLHPFNEYLLLVAEYGVVGLTILIAGFVLLIKSSKISSPYVLCLVSLGIFSLFSYPLKYPFTWVIVAYCLAQIGKNKKQMLTLQFPTKIWFKIIGAIIVIAGFIFLARDVKFECQWNKVAKMSLMGKTREITPQYEILHHSWNGNHLFLYN